MKRILTCLLGAWLCAAAALAGEPAAPAPAPEPPAIQKAIDAGNAEEVGNLLAADAALLTAPVDKMPLLHYCIAKNQLEVFKTAIAKGANVNQVNDLGQSPLIFAAVNLRPEFIRDLAARDNLQSFLKDKNGKDAAKILAEFDDAAIDKLAAASKRPASELQQALAACRETLDAHRHRYAQLGEGLLKRLPAGLQAPLRRPVLGLPLANFAFAGLCLVLTWLAVKVWRGLTGLLGAGKAAETAAPVDPANPAATRKVCWCSLIAAAARRAGVFFLACLGIGLAVCFVFPCLSEYARWLLPPLVCIAVMLFVYDLALAIEELAARGLEKMGVGRDATLLTLLRRLIRFVAVFWAILYLYERYSGSSLTTILAGLGIGGMAFAFAATDTIKNFIAFILILLDKPFVVGDHVVIGPNDGTVEYIGLRTTRIRASADGVPITLPNAQAVDTVMRNVSHQRCHHRADAIALAKDATPEQIRKALEAVKEVLNAQPGLVAGMPPQAHFLLNAGAGQINYEYWFDNAAGDFAAFNERLSLALLEKIAAVGVPLA